MGEADIHTSYRPVDSICGLETACPDFGMDLQEKLAKEKKPFGTSAKGSHIRHKNKWLQKLNSWHCLDPCCLVEIRMNSWMGWSHLTRNLLDGGNKVCVRAMLYQTLWRFLHFPTTWFNVHATLSVDCA